MKQAATFVLYGLSGCAIDYKTPNSHYTSKNSMKDTAIVLFTRYPERGRVKTRLAGEIGADLAYDLYLCFLRDTIEKLRFLDADLIVAGAGKMDASARELFGDAVCIAQHGHNLGIRMYHAFKDVFALGYSGAVIIGSDIPDLPAEFIISALNELARHDIVLGPCADGGYYLIAFHANKLDDSVFQDIPWSTSRALAGTIEKINNRGLRAFFLPEWDDIDDLKGLKRFYEKQLLNGGASHTRRCMEQYKGRIYGKI